jgi:phosphonate transport system permease protein
MAKSRHVHHRYSGLSPVAFSLAVVLGALAIAALSKVGPTPQQLVDGVPNMVNLLDRMLPPNTDPDFLKRVGHKILETLQIAFAGAAIGIVLSVPIAWLAARGVSPIGRASFVVKCFVALLRTVPDLVWALLFVATVGLGAVAGTLTIIVDTIGFCGRFFAEAMEDSDKESREALSAIGASSGNLLTSAILPDAAPSMVNSSLFSLEKAVRSSVVLGLVGAGGIGQELKVSFDLFQYPNASAIIAAIFVIVLLMEIATDALRKRLE